MTLQSWRDHPEHVEVRQFMFRLHFWIGAVATLWVVLISMTGAVLVFRDELSRVASLDLTDAFVCCRRVVFKSPSSPEAPVRSAASAT